jgi:hypothetical protein
VTALEIDYVFGAAGLVEIVRSRDFVRACRTMEATRVPFQGPQRLVELEYSRGSGEDGWRGDVIADLGGRGDTPKSSGMMSISRYPPPALPNRPDTPSGSKPSPDLDSGLSLRAASTRCFLAVAHSCGDNPSGLTITFALLRDPFRIQIGTTRFRLVPSPVCCHRQPSGKLRQLHGSAFRPRDAGRRIRDFRAVCPAKDREPSWGSTHTLA